VPVLAAVRPRGALRNTRAAVREDTGEEHQDLPGGCPRPTGSLVDPDVNEDGMKLALDIVLIVSSLVLVLLILLHRGRGGGLSSLFGGGVQSSLSGSSVAEKNLDRMTLFTAAIWLISIVGTGVLIKIG
jgi:preprotein translocase subunit SecG